MRTNVELEACFAEAAGDRMAMESARQRLTRITKPAHSTQASSHGIQ
jgi:hypothetical protein